MLAILIDEKYLYLKYRKIPKTFVNIVSAVAILPIDRFLIIHNIAINYEIT